MLKDNLGDRMKQYEYVTRDYLMGRTPIIIRLDGCHFHTVTKRMNKPFDMLFVDAMQETMLYLCKNIPGCVLGYTQSDEITLVLQNYKTLETGTWFDGNIQKIVSVSAAMATMAFNKHFAELADQYLTCCDVSDDYQNWIAKVIGDGAYFDSRVFNVPREEVTNCVLWRQMDAMRNSVNMVGFANFSPKQMHGKNVDQVKDMLRTVGIDYDNDIPLFLQRGTCCVKIETASDHGRWILDRNIPVFKGEGREYIEQRVTFE